LAEDDYLETAKVMAAAEKLGKKICRLRHIIADKFAPDANTRLSRLTRSLMAGWSDNGPETNSSKRKLC
jgi:hypothetical protein